MDQLSKHGPWKKPGVMYHEKMDCDAYNQMIYNVEGINADMAKFQDSVKENAAVYDDIGITAEDQVVSLSTCKDTTTSGRAVAIGKLIPMS